MNLLPSLTKLYLSPKPVTFIFVNFTVSDLTSIRQLPVQLLVLSSTPNLITVILSAIHSLSLNYPVSNRSRTFLLVLLLKLKVLSSLASYALSTGSGSLNTLNTSSSRSFVRSLLRAGVQPTLDPSAETFMSVQCASPGRGGELVGVCGVCASCVGWRKG